MMDQFESARPLTKKIARVCHQAQTGIIIHALVDTLAGLVISHIPDEDRKFITQEITMLLSTQVRYYEDVRKPKRVRRKRNVSVH